MKISFFVLWVFISVVFLSCEKRCKNGTTEYPLLEETKSYFDVYKEGNWWVYQNQDSTKQDSLYITNYVTRVRMDEIGKGKCNAFLGRRWDLHSKYLYDGQVIETRYENSNCCRTIFYLSSTLISLYIVYNFEDGYFSYAGGKPMETFSSKVINNQTYNNILKTSQGTDTSLVTYLFGANVGLIQYSTSSDTFSLIKYNIN